MLDEDFDESGEGLPVGSRFGNSFNAGPTSFGNGLSGIKRATDAKASRWEHSLRTEADYAEEIWRGFVNFIRYCANHGVSPGLVDSTALLGTYAFAAAQRMVSTLTVKGARTWREAARKAGRTEELYAALRNELAPGTRLGSRYQELIRRNAELISSFPARTAERISEKAAMTQQQGGRSVSLIPELMAVGKSHARMLARTEVSKASTELTRARSEDLELPWYVWRTSKDERVRHSHHLMENVLVRWDDPPSPEALAGEKSSLGVYNAGEAPNDRCYPEPVVTDKQLHWPHKAYVGGRVRYITLAQFRAMN